MGWKIYYGDGTTYSSNQGGPDEAPARNVQVIVLSDKYHGWYTQAKSDYYVWDERGEGEMRWWGVDIFGLYDYMIEPGWKRVLYGRTLTSDRFQEIFKMAMQDEEFPKKTAFDPAERRP